MPFDKLFGKLKKDEVIRPDSSEVSVGFDLDDSTHQSWMDETEWSNVFSSRVFYPTERGLEWYAAVIDRVPEWITFMITKSPMTKLNYLDKYHNESNADIHATMALKQRYISFDPDNNAAQRDIALSQGFTLENHLDSSSEPKT
jgi:hypothetical protein